MAKKSPIMNVLVVDDEALIRWSLAETLGDCGHEVTEAGDGAGAVRAASRSEVPFDAILLDFRLPDSNDLTLLTTLRRLAPRARIIMMTAYSTPEMERGALDLGVYRVVHKPFEVNELAALVSETDGRSSA